MQAVRAYIDTCQRFAWPLVLGVTALTVAAIVLASQLAIEADVARLLPRSAPSVAGLERLDSAYGGQIGRLTVVLEGQPTRESRNPNLERLADRLVERLAPLDGVERIEAQKPLEFFARHRLLYADIETLRTVKVRLEERIRWEKEQANPLFVDLEEGSPPEVDFAGLADGHQQLEGSSRFISDDGRMLVFFVYPSFSASELEQSKRLVERVDQVVSSELAGSGQISYGLTGRYKKRVDLQAMLERDLAVSMSLALALILVFLIAFLRSIRGTLVVVMPLVVGTIWTFGWAELSFGSLNILTAFLGAVLMGLGVDYGIHLYSRFHELAESFDVREALVETLASTGRANLFAALTTMVALGSLMVSEFRAFFEFGVIALGGLMLIMISYGVLFPCAVLLADRYGWELAPPASRALGGGIVAGLMAGSRLDEMRRMKMGARAAKIGLVLIVVAASFGLPHLEFVRDFSVLQSTGAPSWKLDERVNELLGQSQTPAVVLTDSEQQSAQVVDELRQRAKRLPEGYTIDKVVSLSSFIPEQQRAKIELLSKLSKRLEALLAAANPSAEKPSVAKEAQLEGHLEEIRRVLREGHISAMDLPDNIRRPFSRTDTLGASVVLVFPAIDLSNMSAVDDYARVLRNLPGIDSGHGYDAISDVLLLSDIIDMAERDAIWMLVISLLGLLILSVIAFRSKTLVALQLTVLAVAMLVALGINGLFGVDFNFMNVVVLPIWIGLGVDASFHIMLHVDNGHHLRPHANTALAVSAAYLTSMVGFGTLLLARHNGLFSLGQVAVLGLGSILLINLLVQMILIGDRRRTRDAPTMK
jgi:predicted RND superfamily exporter protein